MLSGTRMRQSALYVAKIGMPVKELKVEELRKLDGDVPLFPSIPYGVQHILAMFVSNLAPVSILAVVAGLSGASIALVVQTWRLLRIR